MLFSRLEIDCVTTSKRWFIYLESCMIQIKARPGGLVISDTTGREVGEGYEKRVNFYGRPMWTAP